MKKFAFRACLFLILLLVAAYLLQQLIDRGLQKSSEGHYKEWNDMLHSRINADLLIQGSSRAMMQYSPMALDTGLHLNSYNLGIDGLQFRIQYYRLLFYLKYNRAPKYIVQNIDHHTFVPDLELYGYTQFLPYLNDEIIRKGVIDYLGLNWKDIYIPMYKYHGDIALAWQGFLNNFRKPKENTEKYKGFQIVYKSWDSSFKAFKEANPNGWHAPVVENTKNLFKQYLDMCAEKKIQVIFVYAPEYIDAQKLCVNLDSVVTIFNEFSSAYNIPFLDYRKDSICLDTLNFYNSQHMNAGGVIKFDSLLVKDLKTIIKKE